jgi:hypothetical protein
VIWRFLRAPRRLLMPLSFKVSPGRSDATVRIAIRSRIRYLHEVTQGSHRGRTLRVTLETESNGLILFLQQV